MMRATVRTAARAALPLRYSQGFNPHPILSLACPRPVGVTARDDLLVVSLDAPVEAEELLRRLNAHAPRGMRFLRAQALQARSTPRACRADYQLPLPSDKLSGVSERLARLAAADSWKVERFTSSRGGGKAMKPRVIDLKPLVTDVRVDGQVLRWRQVPQGDLWARPGELLGLLGLDDRVDLAAVERTTVEYKG